MYSVSINIHHQPFFCYHQFAMVNTVWKYLVLFTVGCYFGSIFPRKEQDQDQGQFGQTLLSQRNKDISDAHYTINGATNQGYHYEALSSNELQRWSVSGGLFDTEVHFLHFPKCGTSFKNTILATASVCQHLLATAQATAEQCRHIGIKALNASQDKESEDFACCHMVGGFHQPFKQRNDSSITAGWTHVWHNKFLR